MFEQSGDGWQRRTVRLGWGVGDQALSSLTNLALAVLIARSVGPAGFGAFSLAFATYLLALGAARALTSEPLSIRYSGAEKSAWRSATASSAGTAIVVGCGAGLACIAAGIAAGGQFGGPLVALGVTMPGLLVQDTWRFSFFAGGRGASAFLNDLVWSAVLGVLLIAVDASGTESAGFFVAAWGGAATVAAIIGSAQARVAPHLRGAVDWLCEHRDLGPRFLGEFAALGGAGQLALYAVGAIAGLASVGALRAGQVLLGPLNVLFMGIGLVSVPEAVRLLAVSPRQLRNATKLISLGLSAVAVTWGLVLLGLPAGVGEMLLGESWPAAHQVVLPLAIAMAGTGVLWGPLIGLRALANARRSLQARLVGAPLTILAAAGGAAVAGELGAAIALVIASWATAALFWLHFTAAFREREGRIRRRGALRRLASVFRV